MEPLIGGCCRVDRLPNRGAPCRDGTRRPSPGRGTPPVHVTTVPAVAPESVHCTDGKRHSLLAHTTAILPVSAHDATSVRPGSRTRLGMVGDATPAPGTDRLGRCGQVAGTARPCWPNRRREPVAVTPGQSSDRVGAPRLGGTRCQAICLAAIAGSISGSDRLPSTTGTVSTPVWASSAARRFARSTSRA